MGRIRPVQSASAVLMVEPTGFAVDEDTASVDGVGRRILDAPMTPVRTSTQRGGSP